jgi:hypothetical protein
LIGLVPSADEVPPAKMPASPARRRQPTALRRLRAAGCALGLWLLLALAPLLPVHPALGSASAQGVELAMLQLDRNAEALQLDFAVRLTLPPVVEDALQRGVPIYFIAEATVLRSRWYWRDERVARVARRWRIAYQPLTSTWRVGLGGLQQTVPTLAEALTVASRSGGWVLVDADRLDPGSRYRVQFSYRLDSSQLPGPMQFGLGSQGDWAVGVSRTLAVE